MKTITINGVQYQLTPIPTEAPKPVQWEPNRIKKGYEYYSFNGDFEICRTTECNDFVDATRSDSGNYFYTKQEAKEAAKQVRQLLRLRAYVREFAPDWKVDWSNDTQEKWFIYYDHSTNEWDATFRIKHKMASVHMPEKVAIELARKLNSGEVVL